MAKLPSQAVEDAFCKLKTGKIAEVGKSILAQETARQRSELVDGILQKIYELGAPGTEPRVSLIQNLAESALVCRASMIDRLPPCLGVTTNK